MWFRRVLSKIDAFAAKGRHGGRIVGNLLVEIFHHIALFVIGAIIVWAATAEFLAMLAERRLEIVDILLLFIYFELGAMVGIYFKTSRLPVRFLIYVAITAMTRALVGELQNHPKPSLDMLYLPLAILLLAVAVMVIRFTSSRYPNNQSNDQSYFE